MYSRWTIIIHLHHSDVIKILEGSITLFHCRSEKHNIYFYLDDLANGKNRKGLTETKTGQKKSSFTSKCRPKALRNNNLNQSF